MTPEKSGNWLDRAEAQLEAYLKAFWDRWSFWIAIAAGLMLMLVLFFWPRIFITVRSGEQGVMFRRFGSGTITDETYGEGLHLVPPWDTLFIYDVRIQQKRVEFQVLTNDGLEVRTEVSVRYHPRIEQVGLLHKRVGPEYFDKIVRPAIVSKLRATAGGLKAEEIYSTKRAALEKATQDSIRNLDDAYLVLDELLIERVTLPEQLQHAIQNKEKAEQLVLEYDYRLQQEAKEAERKRIEARGVRDFQDIIAKGISEELLRWRGIEATLELAKSDNTKVIVVGGSKDGLPLIFDTTAGAGRTRELGGPAAAEKKPTAPAAAPRAATLPTEPPVAPPPSGVIRAPAITPAPAATPGPSPLPSTPPAPNAP